VSYILKCIAPSYSVSIETHNTKEETNFMLKAVVIVCAGSFPLQCFLLLSFYVIVRGCEASFSVICY